MTRLTRTFRLLMSLYAASAASAHAQTAQPTPLPGLDDFTLPASRPTPRAVPSAEPTTNPRPAATPTPTASATPRAKPPRALPTVRATPTPVPRATPTPTARTTLVARPTPLPTARVSVPQATPSPVPLATPKILPPVALPTVEPTVAPLPSPLPISTPTPTVAIPPARTDWWLWSTIGGVALAGLLSALFAWWRKRALREDPERRDDRAHEIFLIEKEDVAPPSERQPAMLRPRAPTPPPSAPPSPALATPPSAPPTPAERAVLDLELIPNRAGTDAAGASIDYLIVVRNTGKAAASNIRLDVRLLGAGTQQDAVIAALFAQPVTQSVTPPFAMDPGVKVELGGSAAHPRETLYAVELGGRAMFVPVLAVNLAYDWPGGSGQTAQSWVIGIARGAEAKLQPFRLDGPPRMFENVSALEYPVAVAS